MYSGFLAGWGGGFFSGFLATGGLFGAGGGDRLRLEEEEELESLFRAGGSCFLAGLPPLLEDQVWSLTQFYYVDISQTMIVFYKRTIKVRVSCC